MTDQDKLNAEVEKLKVERQLLAEQVKRVNAETKKIEKETNFKPKSIFGQLEFWKTAATVTLALLGFFYTYFSGFFDLKEIEIKNRVALQKLKERDLSEKIEQLEEQSIALETAFEIREDSINIILEAERLDFQKKEAQREINEKKLKAKLEKIGEYKNQADKIKALNLIIYNQQDELTLFFKESAFLKLKNTSKEKTINDLEAYIEQKNSYISALKQKIMLFKEFERIRNIPTTIEPLKENIKAVDKQNKQRQAEINSLLIKINKQQAKINLLEKENDKLLILKALQNN